MYKCLPCRWYAQFPAPKAPLVRGKRSAVGGSEWQSGGLPEPPTGPPAGGGPPNGGSEGHEPGRCRWQMKPRRSECRGRQDASLLCQAQQLPGTANGIVRIVTIPQSPQCGDSPAGPAPLLSASRTFSPLTGKSAPQGEAFVSLLKYKNNAMANCHSVKIFL